MKWHRILALAFGLVVGAARAGNGFPAAYAPIVVLPQGVPQRYEFDLDDALARARAAHKRLYVYLGADNCAYCRQYEAFLSAHARELVPEFGKDYLVVDLRSTLSAQREKVWFRIDGRSRSYIEFTHAIGDERERQLVYPSVWLLDGHARQLMQMPTGAGTFETVPEQLEILHLVQ
ncbi:MAG: thioredoxin family protein [Burkholderiales bacterium]|nr:thioredoxin family protein [Burkholderiales bacterium]MDE1928931.1 thioredoxin family protein [Burkholderiales bacterium]MDE2157508.1 thioredoxin family protein [Burkholderiales bacterium]MDE2503147.1 thioredoxin family protein [Burkholderiales bacterium]